MGPTPTDTNTRKGNCAEVVTSNCVIWDYDDVPCLGICRGMKLTDVMYKEAILTCQLLQQITSAVSSASATATAATTPINFSSLSFGCAYSPVVSKWGCPCFNQTFIPDTSAPNGAGYCQFCPTPSTCVITTCVPVFSTVANPTPPPTILIDVLQLVINAIPCCDPCN